MTVGKQAKGPTLFPLQIERWWHGSSVIASWRPTHALQQMQKYCCLIIFNYSVFRYPRAKMTQRSRCRWIKNDHSACRQLLKFLFRVLVATFFSKLRNLCNMMWYFVTLRSTKRQILWFLWRHLCSAVPICLLSIVYLVCASLSIPWVLTDD